MAIRGSGYLVRTVRLSIGLPFLVVVASGVSAKISMQSHLRVASATALPYPNATSHTRGRPGSAEPEAAPKNREICHENSQRYRYPCDYCCGGCGRILVRRLL